MRRVDWACLHDAAEGFDDDDAGDRDETGRNGGSNNQDEGSLGVCVGVSVGSGGGRMLVLLRQR